MNLYYSIKLLFLEGLLRVKLFSIILYKKIFLIYKEIYGLYGLFKYNGYIINFNYMKMNII